MVKQCLQCKNTYSILQFKFRNRRVSDKRDGVCIHCAREYSKRWARAQRALQNKKRTLESFLTEDAFEFLNESQSIQILRRALKLPTIRYVQMPCIKCGENYSAMVKAGRRQVWHCRFCLKMINREAAGLDECGLGR